MSSKSCQLFLVRHAPAQDRTAWAKEGQPDELRPLTDKGHKQFKQAAKSFAKLHRPQVIVSSDMLRADQTAKLMKHYLKKCKLVHTESLGSKFKLTIMERMVSTLSKKHSSIALVGHQPSLSLLLSSLLTAGKYKKALTEFNKGGIACLTLVGSRPARWQLEWLLTMKQVKQWQG